MDLILSGRFIITALVLIYVGAFADNIKNSGDILISGFCVAIIYTIGYIIIQAKKMDKKFLDNIDNKTV